MGKTKKEELLNDHGIKQKQIRFTFFSELMQRYFKGTAGKKEITVVDSWDAEVSWERNREVFDEGEIDESCDKTWEKINKQLHFERENRGKVIQLRHGLWVKWFSTVAATFILVVFSTFYFIFHSYNKISFQTTNAETKHLTLPDGSQLFLNRGTKVSYVASGYNKYQREIWLEGEAFFDVKKDPTRPFIIHSGKVNTTVRGTSFNIKAYRQLDENIVSVRSGKVEVSSGKKIMGVLTKNMQLVYHLSSNEVGISETNWEDAAGWMDERLIFRRATVGELRLRLKQYFDIDLEIRDNALNDNNTLLNASFRKGASLKEVMDVISVTVNIRYRINPPHQVIISN